MKGAHTSWKTFLPAPAFIRMEKGWGSRRRRRRRKGGGEGLEAIYIYLSNYLYIPSIPSFFIAMECHEWIRGHLLDDTFVNAIFNI